MSDDDNNGRPPGSDASATPPRRTPLSLTPRSGGAVNAGTVKQSFSHGRSKTVVVETKRRRVEGGPMDRPRPASAELPPVAGPRPTPAPLAGAVRPAAPASTGGLSQDELAKRQRVLDTARAEDDRRTEARRAEEAQAAAERREADARAAAARAAEAPAAPAQAAAPEPQAAAPAPQAPAAPPAPPEPPRGAFGARDVRREDAAPRPSAPRDAAPRESASREASRLPEGRVYASPRPAQGAGYGDRPQQPSTGYGDRPRPQGDRPGYGAAPGARPAPGGYGDRAPARPAGGGYGAPRSGPGGAAPGGYGGDRLPRPPREGETVRYSAIAPRPAPGAMRSGPGAARPGMAGRGAPSAPSTPELTKTTRSAPPAGAARRPGAGRDDDDRRGGGPGAAGKAAAPGKAVSRTRGEPKRREGRLTIQIASGEDTADRMRSLASVRRAREREREKRKGGGGAASTAVIREVVIPDAITVQELGNRMAVRGVDIIKYMMRQGAMLTINDVLDADTAELIATEFGHPVKRVSESDVETGFLSEDDHEEGALPRPPVVAVMGHVDHGKTSLLDALRTADVAKGEHGGITQHIGAYQVTVASGDKVTFLDTPGHAAFSQMRARGANVTDIVVLVVAADDGVMPQTIEAINHAKSAGAPIIVAINKMDKPGSDPTKVINELLQHEIVVESLGGDTQAIEVSALKKTGLDNLLEAISLQAEVMDLRANPERSAEGVIIEAKLDKGRGPVATVLVKRGVLKRGDIIVAGSAWGKVRALVDDTGAQIKEAGPSMPVEILGLDEAPSPGDALAVVEDEARARELTDYRERVKREKQMGPIGAGGATMADMMAKLQSKKVSELVTIVKADVQGSAEAIVTALEKLGNDEVRARVIHSAAGAINESDVLLAKGANCPILGFNVRASAQARALAEREGVEIRYYAIIYDLLDDMKAVLSGMLSPLLRETFLGNAEVLQVFDISKVGKIAGCRVTEGVVRKGARTRVIRNDIVVQEMGTLQTLKRFKDEVNEVVSGQECGIAFQGFQDLKEGDLVECFTVETVQRTL